MLLPLFGAIIGAAFGGWPGFLIGGVIAYLAGIALRFSLIGGLKIAQNRLIDSTFSIMGALCKADSVVTRDEIKAVEQVFNMFRLDSEGRKQAKAAFNLSLIHI